MQTEHVDRHHGGGFLAPWLRAVHLEAWADIIEVATLDDALRLRKALTEQQRQRGGVLS
ncbi:MAG TPA: hypothetical protein VFB62_20435 [Polyangiaceae bacterium]|nr:hypothetical protein [Polyangiaceae bacterium]